MPYTAAGPISLAVGAVQNLLANVPYFQTWTNTASSAAAAANIFANEVGFPIAAISINANVLTVQTREPHNLVMSQVVTLQGPSIGPQSFVNLDGQLTIVSVTANTFTADVDLPNLATINPDGASVIPSTEPIACVSHDPSHFGAQSIGTGGATIFNGSIDILFENNVQTQYANDPVNSLLQAESEFGQLVQGIAQTSGTLDYVVLNSIETILSPQFIAMQEADDNTARFSRWRAMVKVQWGLKS